MAIIALQQPEYQGDYLILDPVWDLANVAASLINEVAPLMEYNRLQYYWDVFLVATITRWPLNEVSL